MAVPVRGRHRGFTLMELLTAIGIIAVLAALLFPAFTTARKSADGAKCAGNLRQIGAAVMAYAGENDGAFPRGGYGGSGTLPLDPPATDGLGWLTDIYPYVGRERDVFVCPAGEEKSPTGTASWIRMPGMTINDPKYPMHYAYNAQLNTNVTFLRSSPNATLYVDKMISVPNLPGLPVVIDIVFQNNFLGYDNVFAATPSPTANQQFADRHNGRGNILWGDGSVSSMTYQEWAEAPNKRVKTGSYKKYRFCLGDY